ncbi:MAG: tRNA (adenosine(37)-N6)-threonylcarbamoyltransferase complex transferase subunit TsaD [Patescibacteria group bacterium]
MRILSIETSCDETAISLLSISKNKIEVLGDALASQAKLHEEYGGVFPNLARREHQKNSIPLLIKVLKESKSLKVLKSKDESKLNKLKKILVREPELLEHITNHIFNIKAPKIDLIAVTKGPGLEPALWVGISFAKALSELWGIPMIGVNHMEGHIASVLLNESKSNKSQVSSLKVNSKKQFPALSLLVSGGHTELVLVKDWGKYKVVGQTKDDAVGEAFDKAARILGLPYPGGPQISALAETIRNKENKSIEIKLPRPMMHTKDFDFSFSGLKTAVLYMVRDIPEMTNEIKTEIAKEFEDACVEVLIYKTKKAIEHFKVKALIVGGGVSANKHLRSNLQTMANEIGIDLHIPDKALSTDNAIMIAIAGYLNVYKKKKIVSQKNIRAEGHLRF